MQNPARKVHLSNVYGVGKLTAAPEEISRLPTSATSLADAKRKENSLNSRLDLAYKALMQPALATLMANGYRPSTNEAGHQQTTIQTLPKTIGLAPEKMRLFDSFRRARKVADNEGNPVEGQLVSGCIEAAETLLADVRAWLKDNPPDCKSLAEAKRAGKGRP